MKNCLTQFIKVIYWNRSLTASDMALTGSKTIAPRFIIPATIDPLTIAPRKIYPRTISPRIIATQKIASSKIATRKIGAWIIVPRIITLQIIASPDNYFQLNTPDNSFKQNTLYILGKFEQTSFSTWEHFFHAFIWFW